MLYFDTHVHYYDSKFDEDRNEVFEKIQNAGVTKCIEVGCDVQTTLEAIKNSKENEFIYAICGIHPSEIAKTKVQIEKDIEAIKNIVKENLEQKNKVVAIGEIGFDYHYEDYDKDLQKFAFIKQIELANELNLPISIHTRDAVDDTIAVFKSVDIKCGGVIHCCPFNRELVKHGLEKGLHIAFGGTSTYKNSKGAKEIVNMVPNDKMLIETDAPYLAPEPLRGTRNDSSNLKYVVEKLAEFKGLEPEEVAKVTYKNACTLFNIK